MGKTEGKLYMPRPHAELISTTTDTELLGYEIIATAPDKSWRAHVYGGAKR